MQTYAIKNRFNTYRAMVVLALATAFSAAFGNDVTINSTRRVAVASLDPSTAYGTAGKGALGDHAADMLTTELVNLGANALERSQFKKMELEGEMGMTGILDQNSAPMLGQKLGAEWMVVGRITEFGMKKSGGSIGPIRVGNDEARVKIDARIIDARTGLILAAATGAGSEKSGGLRLGGGFNLPRFLQGANFDSNEWQDSQFGKATRKAIRELAIDFAKKWEGAERKWKLNVTAAGETESGSVSAFQPSANMGALKGLSAVVVIPETIFLRPNVPDPAAETEIIKQLLNAGVKVVDDQRAKELRGDREVMAMLRGETNGAKLEELRTMFGADILIVGEGLAERNNQQDRDLSSIFSRARVEIRAIRMDTGEILAAEGHHAPGRDMSEILAGKNALQNAAKQMSGKFIGMMADQVSKKGIAANSGLVKTEIEIGGWPSLGSATEFINAIKTMPGVKSAVRTNFRGGILFATVEFKPSDLDDLAAALETAQSMKRFRLSIQTAGKAKVEGKVAIR